MSTASSFAMALHAQGPLPDLAEKMQLYGQFVGAWEGELAYTTPEGTRRETSAEVHFGWTLQGRAVQDVWIAPASFENLAAGMYGSTTRVYDPESDRWDITWIDPVRQEHRRMIGRSVGEDIVQECMCEDGRLIQWIFTDISKNSFRWLSRSSTDAGQTWSRTGEFQLRRRKGVEFDPQGQGDPPGDFDFWIGSWQVHDPETGKREGDSVVEPILGGHALRERWFGADGLRGESLNIYDSSRGVWHQTWVDGTGQLLVLEGAFDGEAMTLQGRDAAGSRHRIRWTQGSPGHVLQVVELSRDEGATWSALFSGLYTSAAQRTRDERRA